MCAVFFRVVPPSAMAVWVQTIALAVIVAVGLWAGVAWAWRRPTLARTCYAWAVPVALFVFVAWSSFFGFPYW